MKSEVRRQAFFSMVILVFTIIAVAVVLVVGRDTPDTVTPPDLVAGQPSPETFVAARSTNPIEDEQATEAARATAADGVAAVFSKDPEATIASLAAAAKFYTDLAAGAYDDVRPEPPTTTTTPTTTIPQTTSSLTEEEAASTTTSSTTTTTTEPPTTTTTTIPRKDAVEQGDLMAAEWPQFNRDTIDAFVLLYNNDLDRVVEGGDPVFPAIEATTTDLASDELDRGIKQVDLNDIQVRYLTPATQPAIFIPGLELEEQRLARGAISELVGRSLRVNLSPDLAATAAAQEAAATAVAPVTTVYVFGETIANAGDILTDVQVVAIQELELYQPATTQGVSAWAMALLGTLAVMLAAFFLWRAAPVEWSHPRQFALLGILLVLAALVSRVPGLVATENHALGYLMPAVAIGFMAAILFDPRTAVVMSIPMAGFTAISTGDLAFTVYAAAATVIPVGFVSRVASRRQLRLAVLASAVAAAPLAASVEWLFTEDSMPLQAALWAFLGALAAGLIAQGLVSFLENAFGITTSLTLLDLLDRNHPALRRIEEAAPGTFNHSMLVGALAGRAARAIGADPLLAQAAAWYHDLGKTEHPQYFVENQFGVSNPHDSLPPEESAAIIRSHVTEGLRLARRFRIPPDVADGIRMHHGDSLMRFFYHKALAQNPDVDPDLFRHHGVRPRQKEMAIVMISDSIEAAARAYSQEEDPTAEGLQRVVDSVVEEKVTDGQLDRSALTFGDLTAVKGELVQALMGYYHARVPYPGFPGPRVMDAKPVPALPETPTALPESRSEVPG
jgi:hypothetical protein